jgi:hypothetical protein
MNVSDIQLQSDKLATAHLIPGQPLHWYCRTSDGPRNHTFMESLILAQDERWRRA